MVNIFSKKVYARKAKRSIAKAKKEGAAPAKSMEA